MAWFTRTPPRGIEIPDLITAAHEIGHYLAFCEAGVRVRRVEIDFRDGGGVNLVDDPEDDQLFGYLVAVMAGAAGERYWCDVYGQRLPEHCRKGWSYAGDLVEFKAYRRKHHRGLSERKAIRLAHDIVRDNAARFRSFTEKLARDGALRI